MTVAMGNCSGGSAGALPRLISLGGAKPTGFGRPVSTALALAACGPHAARGRNWAEGPKVHLAHLPEFCVDTLLSRLQIALSGLFDLSSSYSQERHFQFGLRSDDGVGTAHKVVYELCAEGTNQSRCFTKRVSHSEKYQKQPKANSNSLSSTGR